MTTYSDKGKKPDVGVYSGFDHCELWVGNAMQAAEWYCDRFGFRKLAYRGLETGSREVVSHVVGNNEIRLVLSSALGDNEAMGRHHQRHGDGVRDIALTVDDCRGVFAAAVARGAKVVREPQEVAGKEGEGAVVLATIATYGDTQHTFVERRNFTGLFLPGFEAPLGNGGYFGRAAEDVDLQRIDHIVGNQGWNEMTPVVEWYTEVLQFHRFWSVDDKAMHTDYSALSSIVVTDYDEVIKLPINEPAKGLRKSQIEEFVDFYGGAGAQHIALFTNDIVATIEAMKGRGTRFLDIPDSYYDHLQERLAADGVTIDEDFAALRRNKILVDYDEKGYLLQIFTAPVEDRPTLFYEVIQRHNHQGFGAGNFKALFRAIEIAQDKRGNL